jgi:hypothetical protein
MIKRRYTRFCPGICPGIYELHNRLQKWTEELFFLLTTDNHISVCSVKLTHLPQLRGFEDGISNSYGRNQAIFCTTFSITFGLLGMRIFIL